METDCTLIETYPTISKAIEQSIADTGSIHTADKELERIIANAIKNIFIYILLYLIIL